MIFKVVVRENEEYQLFVKDNENNKLLKTLTTFWTVIKNNLNDAIQKTIDWYYKINKESMDKELSDLNVINNFTI